MKILGNILFVLAILLCLCFMTVDQFLLYWVMVPIVSIILTVLICIPMWWKKPHWFCSNWPYMFDKQRKKYLEQQKQKRNYYRKKFHFGTLER